MRFFPRFLLLSAVVIAFWQYGCNNAGIPSDGPTEITLILNLPGSKQYPEYKRGAKLVIDGKDYTDQLAITGEFKEKAVTIANVPVGKDQKAVKITYSFWTNNYTHFFRPKVVVLDNKLTKFTVDMTKEDPENKDHIEPRYVPTPNAVVLEMLKMAKVTKDDVVWDIGCGDGRMVIMAAEKFGAKKGLGIDINPERIAESNENLKKSTVGDRVTFKVGNALELKDVSEASVVLLYMGDDLNLRLRPVLQQTLKPGSRVVSHRFKMGDWEPDDSIKIKVKNDDDEDEEFRLHLWTIREPKKQ